MVSNNNIASSTTTTNNKRETKTTIWVRSKPIDKTKQFKEGHAELDLSNIITGTRKRKNVNYRKCHLSGELIEVKRSSINCLEKRATTTRGIKKQKKTTTKK